MLSRRTRTGLSTHPLPLGLVMQLTGVPVRAALSLPDCSWTVIMPCWARCQKQAQHAGGSVVCLWFVWCTAGPNVYDDYILIRRSPVDVLRARAV